MINVVLLMCNMNSKIHINPYLLKYWLQIFLNWFLNAWLFSLSLDNVFNSLVSFNPEKKRVAKTWKRRNSRMRDGMGRQRKPVMEWKRDARSKSLLSVGAMWSPSPLGCFWLELLFFPPRTMQVSLTFSQGGHPVYR